MGDQNEFIRQEAAAGVAFEQTKVDEQPADLVSAATAVIEWCDKNPPAGDALHCIALLRAAVVKECSRLPRQISERGLQ
jgi:hypothetical protein